MPLTNDSIIGNTGYTPVWLLCGEVGDRGHGPSTEVEGNSTHTSVDNTGYWDAVTPSHDAVIMSSRYV